MEKRPTTYNTVFNRAVVIAALPLGGITGKDLCDIIMLQVDYAKAVEDFNRRMEEGLKKLKEEKYPDFDAETGKPEGERRPEYKAWLDELTALYTSMRAEEAKKTVEKPLPKVTRPMLEALCAAGVEGAVTFPGGTEDSPNAVPKAAVLRMVAEMIEE